MNAYKEFKENRLEEGKRIQAVFEKKIQKMLKTKKKLLSAIPDINKNRIAALSAKVGNELDDKRKDVASTIMAKEPENDNAEQSTEIDD